MPKFQNTRTGLVVDVPEDPVTRTDRPKRDKQWSEHLRRLSRSKRWERVPDSTKVGMPKTRPKRKRKAAPEPASDNPLTALKVDELKALAGARGVELGEAKTKAEIVAAIEAAAAGQPGGNGDEE